MMAPVSDFQLRPLGPFSLAAGAAFLEGFAPAAHQAGAPGHLHLAFVADGGEEAAGVCLRQPSGVVVGQVYGDADLAAVRDQAARILSLDVDGSGFPEIGRRDPVIGRLQAHWPGLRPVGFFSPYEAAAWCLITHRISVAQAAGVKRRMAAELGEAVDVHGDLRHAFPGPARLARLDGFPGLYAGKVENLRSLGRAAAAGRLDAARLRALPRAEALAELKRLPGVGDFFAELILLRGAGDPDHLPVHEPLLRRAVALAYELDGPPDEAWLAERAEAWRPYRTWAVLLLRALLEERTGEAARREPRLRPRRPGRARPGRPGPHGGARP
jgi:DNA-3-methyladenine glycosylase II